MMMKVSYFHGGATGKIPSFLELEDIFTGIKHGAHKVMVEQARALYLEYLKSGDKNSYTDFKKKLPAHHLSEFKTRDKDTLVEYTGLVQGDIDRDENPSLDSPEKLRDRLAQDPHVQAAYLSPSGHGVKLWIRVVKDSSRHLESFRAARRYFMERHEVALDEKCKDINRLFFVSHDPEALYNSSAIAIPLEKTGGETPLLDVVPEPPISGVRLDFDATQIPESPSQDTDWERAEEALQFIPPDDYGRWVEIGMALKALLGEAGYELWDQWSARSAKYRPEEMQAKWDSFDGSGPITGATLFHRAREHGGVPSSPPPAKLVPLPKPEVIPQNLLRPPGFVGEFAKFITDNSRYPQRELALGASFALAATLLGRKVRTQEDTRPNLFVVGLAHTGAGKESARKFIKKVFAQTGVSGFGAEKMTGKTAIERILSASPSAIFLIDEFGMYLKHIMGDKAPAHVREVASTLMELFSSNESAYFGTDKASVKDTPRYEIDQPAPTLYATTTPSEFWESLSSANVRNGSLNRFLIFSAPDGLPKRQRVKIVDELPQSITKPVHRFDKLSCNPSGSGNLKDVTGTPKPLVIPYSNAAYDHFERYTDECEKIVHAKEDASFAMHVRSAEYAKKIALILAAVQERKTISQEHAEYAVSLVRILTHNACIEIRNNLADNPYERLSKRVEQIIRDAGQVGIELSRLTGATRFLKDARERRGILDDLVTSGVVIADKQKTVRHPVEVYRINEL